MLYTQKEHDEDVERQIDKLLREIVKNNSKCQHCSLYHPEILGEGGCFIAFKCVQQDFKGFLGECKDEDEDEEEE